MSNTVKQQCFKRYSAALKAANGKPVLRVGQFYVTGMTSLDEVALIDKKRIVGNITMRHLNRLGNGNWAIAGGSMKGEINKEYSHGQVDWTGNI